MSLDLGIENNSQQVSRRERINGAIANKDLNRAIKAQGGGRQAYIDVDEVITEETFGCNRNQLYSETGSKRGDRGSLPKEAQKAYFVADTLATHDLSEATIKGHSERERNIEITEVARDSARETRKRFPW